MLIDDRKTRLTNAQSIIIHYPLSTHSFHFFFFNDTPTTEIYTLSLHDALPISFGDFDNDGDVDILIVNQNEPPSLLRNDVTGGNHWIKIKLVGTKSNRSAIGACVIARYGDNVQAQEVLSQSSYLSANDSRLHFGLGPATTVNLEIRWPSGQSEKLTAVAADQLVFVTEGSGITEKRKLAAS